MPRSLLFRILFLLLLLGVARPVGAGFFLPSVAERQTDVMDGAGDYVVVVHGWAWLRDTMRPMAQFLNDQGYTVVSIRYDARNEMPEKVVENRMDNAVREYCTDPARKIHFVGHSMGGLLIRDYLARHRPDHLGRTVLVAPPNHGIEAVDPVKDWKLFRKIFGEPARQLGTVGKAMAARLGPADFPLGVVMGRDVSLPVLSMMLPGADDGVVAVESGRLEGMADFTTIRCGHMGLPANATVQAQTLAFLREGSFDAGLVARETEKSAQRKRPLRMRPGGK